MNRILAASSLFLAFAAGEAFAQGARITDQRGATIGTIRPAPERRDGGFSIRDERGRNAGSIRNGRIYDERGREIGRFRQDRR